MTAFTHEDHRPPSIAADMRAEGPDHARFGILARRYAREAGSFPGEAGRIVREADTLLAQVSAKCQDAVDRAARVAGDISITPDGRKAVLGELAASVGEDTAAKIRQARVRLQMAEAELTVAALPKVASADRMTARADAEMVLRNVPARELPSRMGELAQRDDAVAALVASSWGQDYLASNGVADPRMHRAVVSRAVEAAATSGDPQRAAAAQAIGRLADMHAAADAAGLQARHAQTGDLAAITRSVHDPAAAEIERLRTALGARTTG